MAMTSITEALPAELRNFQWVPTDAEYTSTYGHLSKRRPAPGHETTAFVVSLLLASCQIYHEARPVFFKVNTFRVKRTEFCDGTALKVPTFTELDFAHLTHLKLYDLTPGASCSLTGPETCKKCSNKGLNLLTYLATIPHLRTVSLDYSETDLTEAEVAKDWTRTRQSERTFLELKNALQSPVDKWHGFGIACLGVGKYQIRGERLGELKITCCDSCLANAWSHFLARPYATRQEIADVINASDAVKTPSIHSSQLVEIILAQLLLRNSDSLRRGAPATIKFTLVPEAIARIWTAPGAIDVGTFEDTSSSRLLDRFNGALREYMDTPFEELRWLRIA